MITYPDCIGIQTPPIAPLLGSYGQGEPFQLDMGSEDPREFDLHDQEQIQEYIDEQFKEGYTYGLSNYLINRKNLLSVFPQMQKQKRYYHLGLDVIAPAHTPLYAPLEGRVVKSEYESGNGNFGGVVILEHDGPFERFYSLYGHLDISILPPMDKVIPQGNVFSRMGEMNCNGNWFYHTHLQILTQKGMETGWDTRGYCTKDQLSTIHQYCPNPSHLFVTHSHFSFPIHS